MTLDTAKITAEQFRHIMEPPGFLMELVDGALIVSPSPRYRHSHTVTELVAILHPHIDAHRLGRLLTELDVEFGPLDVRRPDLIFVSRKRIGKLDPDGIAAAKDAELIIEVISAGSERRDREDKLEQYAENQIPYYWIVDPNLRTFEAFALAGRSYRIHARGRGNAVVQAKPFDDLPIPLGKLWWDAQ